MPKDLDISLQKSCGIISTCGTFSSTSSSMHGLQLISSTFRKFCGHSTPPSFRNTSPKTPFAPLKRERERSVKVIKPIKCALNDIL
uniref:Uncharacterized protein n=1 Tax=Tetraselmis sp. GSL018 TaxID=582737 RepID=A0A061SCQ5_9CHLO